MIEAINPYAAPSSVSNAETPREDADGVGIWSDGNLLVTKRDVRLPNVCVKTGKNIDITSFKRTFIWIPDWAWFTLFVGGPPLIGLFALFFGRRQNVDIPLCQASFSKRRLGLGVGYALCVAGPAFVVLHQVMVGFGRLSDGTTFVVLMLGLFIALAGIILAAISDHIISVQKIDDDFVWYKGVNHDLLSTLPSFPGQPSTRKYRVPRGDFFLWCGRRMMR